MSRALAGIALLATLTACGYEAGKGRTVVLASQSMALPEETVTLPASAEIVTINCTGCHSPEMILTQPRLKPETWQAEVTKMRTAYKAVIDEKDDPKIVAALVALQAKPPQK